MGWYTDAEYDMPHATNQVRARVGVGGLGIGSGIGLGLGLRCKAGARHTPGLGLG